jgi:hypothetical protein
MKKKAKREGTLWMYAAGSVGTSYCTIHVMLGTSRPRAAK